MTPEQLAQITTAIDCELCDRYNQETETCTPHTEYVEGYINGLRFCRSVIKIKTEEKTK